MGISDLKTKKDSPKTSKPTQAQWEGYSRCLENRYKTNSSDYREMKCRSEFNIPWNID